MKNCEICAEIYMMVREFGKKNEIGMIVMTGALHSVAIKLAMDAHTNACRLTGEL